MPRRGSAHHNARLTDDQVKAMRVIFATWKERGLTKGYGHAARLFRCGRATVRDVILRRTRTDV